MSEDDKNYLFDNWWITANSTVRSNALRTNADPSTLTDEMIWSSRTVYMDYLVRYHRDHFYRSQDKVDVCYSDAVASKLTYYLAERLFAVMPAFYESHKNSK